MKKKLAIIRDNDFDKCPYGLNVTEACKNVGGAINYMTPIVGKTEEEVSIATKDNKVIYHTEAAESRCPYANKILDDFDRVDCTWGDVTPGIKGYLPVSPVYPSSFIMDGPDPDGNRNKLQITYDPREYYAAEERGINVPFGLFSVFASRSNELAIIKCAEKYTNKNINIRSKLEILRKTYYDILSALFKNSSAKVLTEQQLSKLLIIIDDWTE